MRRLALLIPAVGVLALAACQPREEAPDTPVADSTEAAAVDADTAAIDSAAGAAAAEAATSEGTAAAPVSDGAGPGERTTQPSAPAATDSTSRPADATPLIPLPARERSIDPAAPEAPQSLPRPDTVMPDTTPDGRPAF